MKKSTLLLFLLLSIYFSLNAQNPNYNKAIVSDYVLFPSSCAPSIDGGIIYNGGMIDPIKKQNSQFFMFLDKNGNIKKFISIDSAKYGSSPSKQLKNGNFIFTYKDSKYKNHIVLTKPNFEMIWTLYNMNSDILNILELKNGNLILVSSINSRTKLDLIDIDGKVLWSNSYFIDSSNNLFANGFIDKYCIELSDGNILLLLEAENKQKIAADKSKILKIQATDGSIIWQKEFSSNMSNYEYIFQVLEDSNGDLLFSNGSRLFPKTKYSAYDWGLLKLDKNGNKIWYKRFNILGDFYRLKRDNDKYYGTIFLPPTIGNKQRVIFFTFDNSGKILTKFQENIDDAFNPIFTSENNLTFFSYFSKCKKPSQVYLKQRSFTEKTLCAEPVDLTLSDFPMAESFNFPDAKVEADKKLFLAPNPKILELSIKLRDEPNPCPDTTIVKRCKGDTYTIGKNTYKSNGIYQDTFKTAYCDSIVLTKLAFEETQNINIDTTICEGKAIFLFGKKYDKAVDFSEKTISALGCENNLKIKVNTIKINITTSDETTVKIAESITLSATSNIPNVTWQWQPDLYLSCADCPEPIAQPLESILYTVVASNKQGCRAETNLKVNVKGGEEVFVPDVFSPNGDGINDQFIVFANSSITQIKQFSVFDRWGNQVYDAQNLPPNDASFGWDGTFRGQKSVNGTYTYRIEIIKANGKTKIIVGDVLLQ